MTQPVSPLPPRDDESQAQTDSVWQRPAGGEHANTEPHSLGPARQDGTFRAGPTAANTPELRTQDAGAPVAERGAPWGIREIIAVGFLCLAIMAAVLLPVGVVLAVLGVEAENVQRDPTGANVLLIAQLIIDCGWVGAAYFLSIRRFRLHWPAWGLHGRQPVAVGPAAAALGLAFAVQFAYTLIVNVLGIEVLQPESQIDQAMFTMRSVIPLTLVLVLLVAPLAEEMLFRGFVFHGLQRRLGIRGAALASGLVFALIHVNGAAQLGLIIPFTLIGVIFAMLVACTGSLWNSILVHFSFNCVGAMVSVLGAAPGIAAAVLIITTAFVAGSRVGRGLSPAP